MLSRLKALPSILNMDPTAGTAKKGPSAASEEGQDGGLKGPREAKAKGRGKATAKGKGKGAGGKRLGRGSLTAKLIDRLPDTIPAEVAATPEWAPECMRPLLEVPGLQTLVKGNGPDGLIAELKVR